MALDAEQSPMSWVVETSGEATCIQDYISMHAPVVELLSAEDLALAVQYLNPTLSKADTKSLYKKGQLLDYEWMSEIFRKVYAINTAGMVWRG